jgi:aryl-alcohol dehydrogenase-like predicted oxidoreductase
MTVFTSEVVWVNASSKLCSRRLEESYITPMEKRAFGKLGEISCLTLGGGGIGQVWGPTSRDEAVATVREAVEAGITFLDVAPGYGSGEAELVIGAAFNGRLPDGVRLSTKCMLGNPPRQEVLSRLERSLDQSLTRTKLKRIDLFFLHGQIVPDTAVGLAEGTPRSLFVEVVRPAFEQLVARGRIGAWGISGIGVPATILETINENPPPPKRSPTCSILSAR